MIIENLQKAFDKPLMAFGVTNNIVVALENIDAPTSVDAPYISSFLLDVDLTEADLNVNESVSSVYQIDVNYASHIGSASVNRMIDLVRAKFPIGSYHYFNGSCFGVDSILVSSLPVSDGWAKKIISLNVSGYTPRIQS